MRCSIHHAASLVGDRARGQEPHPVPCLQGIAKALRCARNDKTPAANNTELEEARMSIEGRGDGAKGRRIRLGMVGGGQGAFIGAVHRLAARMDDQYEFVAGALSSTPEKSIAS